MSYFPLYEDSPDNIVGVLDTKDYFRLDDKSKDSVIKNAVDTPFYVPEGMKANVLFAEMRNSRRYFAVIIDEYGGFSGIITLHDLLEALVGDMYEEEEPLPPADIQKVDDNSWCIYGCADLEDVSKMLDVDLPFNEFDTFNGYICSYLEQIPNDGESFELETDILVISVQNVLNHMIDSAIVHLK